MSHQSADHFGISHRSKTEGTSEPVRVLIVDDSAFMRHVITRELTTDPSILVLGAASNGAEAIEKAKELNPDVITLDIEMPIMSGLEALSRILEVCKARVIMFSSNEGVGQANTVRALELGAVDFILKPSGSISPNLTSVRDTLLRAVHGAASATVHRMQAIHAAPPSSASQSGTIGLMQRPVAMPRSKLPARRVLVVGSSTGGPQALTSVIPLLPSELDAGVVVVQHMPAGFTASLAARLNDLSPLHVREAVQGDIVLTGEVLVAPGDFHLKFVHDNGTYKVHLDQGPRVHGVRPSVDVTLLSAAEVLPNHVNTVILTGMGRDGTSGAQAIRNAGGWVLAQDEASCVIYGMPRSVIEAGAASAIYSLKDMAASIVTHLNNPSSLRKGA